jgi:hypothetical protein
MTEQRRAPLEVTCGGKKKLTFTQAKRSAKNLSRRTDATLKAYKCIYCNHYHIGEVHGHYDRKATKRREALRRLDDE